MRRSGWVAVVASVGLGLTGCSDPGTPSDTLPTAASTSAEPTLEPLGPADFPVPAKAREQSEAGAQAMASYYIDFINRLSSQLASGSVETDAFRELTSECEVCDQIASGFDAEVAAGNRYEGGVLSAQEDLRVAVDGGTADVVWVLEQSAATSVASDGSVVREVPATVLRGGVVMVWNTVRDGWIANQMNLVQS